MINISIEPIKASICNFCKIGIINRCKQRITIVPLEIVINILPPPILILLINKKNEKQAVIAIK